MRNYIIRSPAKDTVHDVHHFLMVNNRNVYFYRMKKIICAFVVVLMVISSCKKESKLPPIHETVDLDGKPINDSSILYPSSFLLSAAEPNPSATDLAKPVIIAVHGYSATTFEWWEFRDYLKTKTDCHISVVLLGGHGRDYENFRDAKWEDWQRPIIDEYNKLRGMGYTKISFAASSTGCPLVLNMIRNEKINPDVLKHVFFIDPIINSSNKILSAVSVVGVFLKYTTVDLDPGENGYWYKYRPATSLKQLEKLIRAERKALEKGYDLPSGVTLKVYKAEKDGAADPTSAVMIEKGIQGSVIEMINSDLHVFTRLKGRINFSQEDENRKQKAFEEMYTALFN